MEVPIREVIKLFQVIKIRETPFRKIAKKLRSKWVICQNYRQTMQKSGENLCIL